MTTQRLLAVGVAVLLAATAINAYVGIDNYGRVSKTISRNCRQIETIKGELRMILGNAATLGPSSTQSRAFYSDALSRLGARKC